MEGYVRWILAHRALVISIVLVITGLSAWSLTHAKLSTNLGEQYLGDRPEYLRYQELSQQFESDEVVYVGLEGVDPLDPEVRNRVSLAKDALEALDDVDYVVGPLDGLRVQGDGKTVTITSFADAAAVPGADLELLREELRRAPFVRGNLVSTDGRTGLLAVVLTWDRQRPGEAFPGIVAGINEALVGAGFPEDTHRLVGYVPALTESLHQIVFNVTRLLPLVGFVLLLAVWLLFRRLWPAALTLMVSALSVCWTMGLLIALNPKVHVVTSLMPPVIMVVAFSDVVHLCSAYLLELVSGKLKAQALKDAASEVGRACLWTSATTFVGFASMMIVDDPSTRTLGLGLACGVGVALLLAITLVPVLFSLAPTPRPLRGGAAARIHPVLERCLGWAARVSMDHPRKTATGFLLVVAMSAAALPLVHMDFDLARRFGSTSKVYQDHAWFSREFGNAGGLDVYLHGEEKGALLDPERFARIAVYQDRLKALPDVADAVSLVDLLDQIHAGFQGAGASATGPPPTREHLAQYMMLLDSSAGSELPHLIDWERRSMRISLRTDISGARALAALGDQAEELARDLRPAGITAEPNGLIYLMGHFFDQVFSGQIVGLMLTLFAIMVMMMVGLRSLAGGAVSMIPNLMPVVVLWGVVGLMPGTVDTDVLIITIMAIGIGVDDTIHFLMRYRIELGRGGTRQEAVRGTFRFAGRGILMTTVILVAGFLPCATSGFATMHLLGTLLPLTLVVALAADLFLVPALIELNWLKLPPA